jgi:hypothetical protein
LSTPTLTKARVGGEVVDAVGDRAPRLLDQEIVDAHLLEVVLGPPLAARVLEVADQLLLLRIDGDHRAPFGQRLPRRLVDDGELGVPVGVIGAFLGLAVGVQAEPPGFQQLAHHRVADLVPEFAQSRGERAQALAGPAQRRHRIAAAVGLHERLEIAQQRRIALRQRLAPAAHAANPTSR